MILSAPSMMSKAPFWDQSEARISSWLREHVHIDTPVVVGTIKDGRLPSDFPNDDLIVEETRRRLDEIPVGPTAKADEEDTDDRLGAIDS